MDEQARERVCASVWQWTSLNLCRISYVCCVLWVEVEYSMCIPYTDSICDCRYIGLAYTLWNASICSFRGKWEMVRQRWTPAKDKTIRNIINYLPSDVEFSKASLAFGGDTVSVTASSEMFWINKKIKRVPTTINKIVRSNRNMKTIDRETEWPWLIY